MRCPNCQISGTDNQISITTAFYFLSLVISVLSVWELVHTGKGRPDGSAQTPHCRGVESIDSLNTPPFILSGPARCDNTGLCARTYHAALSLFDQEEKSPERCLRDPCHNTLLVNSVLKRLTFWAQKYECNNLGNPALRRWDSAETERFVEVPVFE